MLFDLKGRRRRLVQVIYLTLAVLMGGGLVFFGIGGDVSGGLFDAFSGNGGGGNDSLVQKRIEQNEKKLENATKADDADALKDLARAHYQLANDEADPNTQQFTDKGKEELAASAEAWERYLALEPKKPDDSLARLMIQVYDPRALNQPAKAAEAAELVVEADPKSETFLQLVQYAALAGQKAKADRAGRKAIELAPKDQKKEIEQFVEQAKAAPAATGAQQAPGG